MNDAKKASFTVSNLYKEEMPACISDAKDRKIISEKLQTCINPLNPTHHPQNMNIATGWIAPDNVNVDCTVSLGQEQMKNHKLALAEVFHNSLEKKIVTMTAI